MASGQETLPSRAALKTHGTLLRELDDYDNVDAIDFDALKASLASEASDLRLAVPKTPLATVVGLKDVKLDILNYLNRSSAPVLENDNCEDNDRVLLFGETGTGKALLTSAIATELECSLIECINPGALFKWEANIEIYTKALFENAQKHTTVLFIKQLQEFCLNDDEKRTVVKFLRTVQSVWQGLGDSRLIIVASTNTPNALDEKLVYAFDRRVYIPTLNCWERRILFQRLIPKIWTLGHTLSSKDMDWVARKTYGILTSEIENIVEKATRVQYPRWPTEHSNELVDGTMWRALEVGDFVEVLRNFAVIDSKQSFEFETFQQKFGNGPFKRVYERENEPEEGVEKKHGKKKSWMWAAIAWI